MDGLAVPAHGFKLLAGTGNRPLAEEIAEALHIRASTARSLLRHGLNNLRRRIVKSTVPEI